MKILLVNNFFYNRGGDCTYLFSLKKLLENKGHKVIVFSMHHPLNFPSEYSKYFVSYINYQDEVKKITFSSGLKVLSKAIFSSEAKKKIEKLIINEEPDIAHLQNIHHHITPSIFFPLKKHKIPIIWTLHDFTLICPNTTCIHRGKICEECKTITRCWKLIAFKCKKNSYAASTMAALEFVVHRITRIINLVNTFISPSEFLRNKLIEHGLERSKTVCINNFIECPGNEKAITPADYCLYAGRLSEEKGIKTLLKAAITLPRIKIKIVGDGPLKEELISFVKARNQVNKIEFLGHRSRDEVLEILKHCRFVIVPSEWYENYPYSILEAFAYGKPVIGSKIGGIPELIREEETGLTYELGNAKELSEKIYYLYNNVSLAERMGSNARKFVERECNAETHYHRLTKVYENALAMRN